MTTHATDPILIVCSDPDRAFGILAKLYDRGFSTVGPAPSACLALTLAAQTMARTAIIASQTTGRRTAEELAGELSRTWGIECFLLGEDEAEPEPPRDRRGHGPMATLRRALGTMGLRRLVH